jgi:hypothetical protein
LEAAFQGSIAFDVLAELVQRGRADGLQFAAGERWLQDVGRVDRAFRRASADERVQLVDEQYAVAAVFDFFDDLLEALLELTAVFGTRYQLANIEG